MGSVYLARHLALGRPLAIKVLDAEAQACPWATARFLREARLAARVRHPNVVDIYDFGSTPEGLVYIVMEALGGRDLRAIVRGDRLDWAWSRLLIRQVCAGVEAIHRAGVVHRDLKASNCFFVEATGQVKVLDFGIATEWTPGSARGPSQGRSQRAPEGGGERPGDVVGTPEYMAPEQIRAEPVDHRADVYALGILLFELLTGSTPFAGRCAEQVFARQLDEPVPPLRSRVGDLEVPPGLDAVLARALAKQPRRRFQSVGELARALDRLAVEAPSQRCARAQLRRWLGARGARIELRRSFGRAAGRGLARPHHEDAPTLRSRANPGPSWSAPADPSWSAASSPLPCDPAPSPLAAGSPSLAPDTAEQP